MKVILAILALVVLVVNVCGDFGGARPWFDVGGGRRGFGGRGFPPPPPHGCLGLKVFAPKCKDFFDVIEKKLREQGPPFCFGANRDECLYQHFLNARQQSRAVPSQDCLDQIDQFLNASGPYTSPVPETTVDTISEQ